MAVRTEAEPVARLEVAVRTDVGRKRAANEDSLTASYPVFIVADGMGGHAAGDLASAAVVQAFSPLVGRVDVHPPEVAAIIDIAHDAVRAISDRHTRGAGSTLTGVVQVQTSSGPSWLLFNVGDSRVYRLADGELIRLTVDHSVAQELVDAGQLRPEDVADFAGRNVITRAMGAEDSPADFWLLPMTPGDRLLVCSDGLTSEVSDTDIRAALTQATDSDEAADRLLDEALDAGGHDNVSLIVLDVIDVPGEATDEPGFVEDTLDVGFNDADGDTAVSPRRGGRADAR